MASSSKKKSKSKSDANLPTKADVVDAVVIEETDPAIETVDEMADADGVTKAGDDADVSDGAEDLVEEEVLSSDDASLDDGVVGDGIEEIADGAAEDTVEVIEDSVAPVPVAEPVKQSSGFFPLVLGGVIAAGLGFFLSEYLSPKDGGELEATVTSQGEMLDGLTAQVGETAALATTLGTQDETLSATDANMAAELSAQAEQIAALEAQVAELTAEVNKPVKIASEAELSADLTALIEAQKEELASLQGDLQSMAAFAEGQIENAQKDIEAAQQEAEAAERAEARASARDSLNEVRLALASGVAFEDALPQIAGAVEIPAALSDVAAGIATQSELQGTFGAVARAALATSNRELAGDSAGDRASLFFQDMIGARSLTPQEGDSPDAVLSRAEAAVQSGDLADALATIEALPEGGKAELTEWSEKAKARNDALQAFSDLTDALSAD